MTTSIIFLDIDGPMIPVKSFYLPNQTKPARIFDPGSVALLLALLKKSKAKLVISSIHRTHGWENVKRTLQRNKIPLKYLHKDWHTTLDITSRSEEIQAWLDAHPNITNYVAIDDEKLDSSIKSTKCSSQDGFGMLNFIESKLILGTINEDLDVPAEDQLKRMKAVLDFYKS